MVFSKGASLCPVIILQVIISTSCQLYENSSKSADIGYQSTTAIPFTPDGCLLITGNNTLTCGHSKAFKLWLSTEDHDLIRHVEKVTVENWYGRVLHLLMLSGMRNLKEFEILSGNLTNFAGDFPPLENLEKIVITDNKIEEVHSTLFKKLLALKTADLQRNNLQTIPQAFILGKNFTDLFLLGNKWDCTKTMKWLLDTKHANLITDLQFLKCSDKKYNGRPICTVMEYKKIVKETCRKSELKNCTCHIYYIQREGLQYSPIYSVNCSYRGFYKLPEALPVNTSVLYISHNKITDLRPLITNPIYKTISDIYLNNNSIESIDILENSEYLNNFRLLNLQGNLLSKISVFPLYNAFAKNHNLQSMFLSENPWLCNCRFTPKFQLVLTKFEFIRDATNISCRHEKENPFSNRLVLSLTKHELCFLDTEEFSVIDVVNVVLAMLIFIILSKLSYDYFQMRYYGRIPWIVKQI